MGSNHERVKTQSDTFPRPRWWELSHHISLFPSVSVGMEMMFCARGCTAVIDTGSSYITGPASSVSLLMETIGAQLDESGVTACNVHSCQRASNTCLKYSTCPLLPIPAPAVQSQLWCCEDAAQRYIPPGRSGVLPHSGGLYFVGKKG